MSRPIPTHYMTVSNVIACKLTSEGGDGVLSSTVAADVTCKRCILYMRKRGLMATAITSPLLSQEHGPAAKTTEMQLE